MSIDKIGNELAEYIMDNEREYIDYVDWCLENNLNPAIITKENLMHIYAKAIYWLLGSGYDIDGFWIKEESSK